MMRKEVTRSKSLPSFQLDLAELGILWHRLLDQFEDSEECYKSLSIELRAEKLRFSDWSEVEEYKSQLPKILYKFSITMREARRSVSLDSSGFILGIPYVSVDGDTEAWCAGTAEIAVSFIKSHKTWYGRVAAVPFTVLGLGIIVNVAISLAFPDRFPLSSRVLFAWSLLAVALGMLGLFQARIFPQAALIIRQEDGFIQRNSGGLTLLVGVLALLVSIAALFK